MAGGGVWTIWGTVRQGLQDQPCPRSLPFSRIPGPGGSWVSQAERQGEWLWGGGRHLPQSWEFYTHNSRGHQSRPVSSQRDDSPMNNETNPESGCANSFPGESCFLRHPSSLGLGLVSSVLEPTSPASLLSLPSQTSSKVPKPLLVPGPQAPAQA